MRCANPACLKVFNILVDESNDAVWGWVFCYRCGHVSVFEEDVVRVPTDEELRLLELNEKRLLRIRADQIRRLVRFDETSLL